MIGILALQGNYQAHSRILDKINIPAMEVKYPSELNDIDGLIIPGGESTTINDLMERVGFHGEVKTFAKKKPILGTCAGLIMMSALLKNDNQISTLGVLDVEVSRNAYGRQTDSFVGDVSIDMDNQKVRTRAPFIRAPKITKIGNSVEVVGVHDNDIVAVRSGIHFGLTFHPELSDITFFHKYTFTKKNEHIKENNAA